MADTIIDEVVGHHRYVLGLTINIWKILVECNGTKVQYLHIYADELVSDNDDGKYGHSEDDGFNLFPDNLSLRFIHIFARSLFETIKPNPKNNAWQWWNDPEKSPWPHIAVFHEVCPPNFRMGFANADVQGDPKFLSTIARAPIRTHAGVLLVPHGYKSNDPIPALATFEPNAEGSSCALRNIPFGELGSPAEVVASRSMKRPNHLADLLRMLFIAASRDMFGDGAAVSRAMSRLKFILRCTRTSGIKTALADSAATLLKRIESPLGLASSTDAATTPALSFDVPVLNMDVYMPVLKAYIDIVVSLEEKKTSVSTNMRDASLRKAEVTAMLTAMSTLCMTDGASPNSQVAVDAVTAVWNTHKAMEAKQDALKSAQTKFATGIDKYQKEEKDKFMWDCIKDVAQIVVSVGVAVATSGAGAPLTIGTLGKAIEELDQDVSKFDRLKVILTKLSDTIPKLYTALRASFEDWNKNDSRVDKMKSVMKLSQDGSKLVSQMPELSSNATDYFSLLAQWDEFEVDIDTMFDSIKQRIGSDTAIEGLLEYKGELRKMAIRARSVLEAQRLASDKVHQYYRDLADNAVRSQASQTILQMSADFPKADEANQLLLANQHLALLDQQLATAKIHVFVNFHEALLSYMYRAGEVSWPAWPGNVVLSADLTGRNYRDLHADLLQKSNEANKAFHSRQTIPKEDRIVVDTASTTYAFAPDWKSFLISDRKILFNVPPNHPQLKEWYRTRVLDVWATFAIDGIELPNVKYYISLGPRFRDSAEAEGTVLHYTVDMLDLFGLKKNGKDGQWDINEMYIYPTASCEGSIVFSAEDFTEFGLEKVTKVTVEFECKGVYRTPK